MWYWKHNSEPARLRGVSSSSYVLFTILKTSLRRLSTTDEKNKLPFSWSPLLYFPTLFAVVVVFPLGCRLCFSPGCLGYDSQLYSVAGGIFLFKFGQYFFFIYPEWYVFSSSLGIVSTKLLTYLLFFSFSWCGVMFLWDFIIELGKSMEVSRWVLELLRWLISFRCLM